MQVELVTKCICCNLSRDAGGEIFLAGGTASWGMCRSRLRFLSNLSEKLLRKEKISRTAAEIEVGDEAIITLI